MPEDYRSKNWLFEQRFVKRLSLRKIAALCGISHEGVRKRLLRHGLSEDSTEVLRKKADRLIQAVMENQDFFLNHVCETEEERQRWRKIINAELDRERKRNLSPEEQSEGRVLRNRQTHPSDRIEHGGGQPVPGYYDPRASAHSFAEEMSLIEELDES